MYENDELRVLLAKRAVDQAMRLTGPMPANATAEQRRALSELVDAADSLAADGLAAWEVLAEGAPDQGARMMSALLVVQAVALLAVGRSYRLTTGGGDNKGASDAPLQ
jgi:D-serine deaminase-like pyridoxal phosphate-dependent protein